MRYITAGLIIATILACDNIFAGDLSYECEIRSQNTISDDGVFELGSVYKGNKFHVDRSTGVVLGGDVGNSLYPTKNILDPGNDQMSYKLIWISDGIYGADRHHNTVYLVIEEYAKQMLKPFILIINATVLTGLCA